MARQAAWPDKKEDPEDEEAAEAEAESAVEVGPLAAVRPDRELVGGQPRPARQDCVVRTTSAKISMRSVGRKLFGWCSIET